MSLRGCLLFLEQFYNRLFFAFDFLLTDFEHDIFFTVVTKQSTISETVEDVFAVVIIRVGWSDAMSDNPDKNAACILLFSLNLPHGPIEKSRFRLACTAFISMRKYGSLLFSWSLFIYTGACFNKARS